MFPAAWQEFYKFVGESAGVEDFHLRNTWFITDTLFCEVSLI